MDSTIDYRQSKKTFSRVSLSLFLFLLIASVFQYLVSFIAESMGINILYNAWTYYLAILAPIYVIAFPVFLLMTRNIETTKLENNTLKPVQILFFSVLVFPLMYIGNIIGLIVAFSLQLLFRSPMTHIFEASSFDENLLANFVFVVIFAPIVEELIFRKILIDRIIRYGKFLSIVVSGLFFGLFHGNFFQFFYATALGMLFAFIYVISGRVRYVIGLHMLVNFLGSVAAPFIASISLEHAEKLEKVTSLENLLNALTSLVALLVYAFILLALTITGVILFITQRKRFRINESENALPRGKRFSVSILNLGSVLFLIGCIGLFVISFTI